MSVLRERAVSMLLFIATVLTVVPDLVGAFDVRGTRENTLVPGSGFACETAQPTRIGEPGEYGYDANSIAAWDVVPYQLFSGRLEVGVVAFHIAGIDRVEFSCDGGDCFGVSSMTVNPRTGVNEYWVTVDAGDYEAGPIELRATVFPLKGNPRVLDSLYLYANSDGSLTGNTVYVSQNGNDSDPGSSGAPVATITSAIDKVTDGGRIVLMDKGVYELDHGKRARWKRLNELYITIEPGSGLDRNDVVIGFGERRVCRPYVRKLHFKNVSIDFGTVQQYYPHGVTWFEGCRWYQSDGAAAIYDKLTYPVRMVDHPYYATDSLAEEMRYGFAGAGLARGCRMRRISGDALQNVQCALNCVVDDVDGRLLEHHTDILQMTLHGWNRIVYGLDVRNIVDTQCVFLDHYQASHTDYAFVDIAFDSHDPRGGPPFTQFNAPHNNVLFRNVKWPGQKMIFRTDFAGSKQFVGRNVVFEKCQLYPTDYSRYVIGGKSPPGVVFKDCYSAPGASSIVVATSTTTAGVGGDATVQAREVYEGHQLRFTLSTGGGEGEGLAYTALDLPKGATFSGGVFEWTPGYDQAGTYQVTFMPIDGASTTVQPIATTISVWNAGRSAGAP